ncbi:hypothetical protein D9M73_93570 [compost metagenome]
MRERRDLRARQVDRARPGVFAAIVARIIDEAEFGERGQRIGIGAIRSAAKRDRVRRARRDEQLGCAANQVALFGKTIFDQLESRRPRALVARHRSGPIRMQMQLHLLPGREDRFHDRPDGREPKGQCRHWIDEEARLQSVPRKHVQLIRHPDARRFQRPRENLGPDQPVGVVAPHQFRVDGQENRRGHPVGT